MFSYTRLLRQNLKQIFQPLQSIRLHLSGNSGADAVCTVTNVCCCRCWWKYLLNSICWHSHRPQFGYFFSDKHENLFHYWPSGFFVMNTGYWILATMHKISEKPTRLKSRINEWFSMKSFQWIICIQYRIGLSKSEANWAYRTVNVSVDC